jgi:hypothetical protein
MTPLGFILWHLTSLEILFLFPASFQDLIAHEHSVGFRIENVAIGHYQKTSNARYLKMVFILVEYIKKPLNNTCGCLLNLNKYPSGESTNIELFVVQEWAV